MPRKPAKPFIDKKNASIYHLVRRSERDIGGYYDEEGNPLDVPRNFVMMPTEETAAKLKKRQEELEKQQYQQQQQEKMMQHIIEGQEFENEPHPDDVLARAKHMLAAADLVDEYDYDKHMLPITGSGVFYGAAGVQIDPSQDIRAKSAPIEEPFIKEVDRQLDAIALSADCLDPELADALFNFEENDFEEILDDFCITADQEPDKFQGDENYEVDDFDFDAHIERLIQKAKLEEKGGPKVVPNNHRAWNEQAKEFTNMKPFSKYEDDAKDDDDYVNNYDEDEYSIYAEDLDDDMVSMNPGVVPKLAPEEEKALCEKFEQALLEYDSDEIGELEDQCYEIKGEKPLEGDIQIEAALDQYLQEKKDEIFILGADYKRDGGGSKVLINGKRVPYNALDVTEAEIGLTHDKADDVLAEANEFLANPEIDLPTEEIRIDGKSYFEMKERNPWDCESILSTYSNLDNNPAVIGRTSRRRRKKKQDHNQMDLDEKIPEDQPVQILLSNKTGLPLGVLPGPKKHSDMDDFDNRTFMSVNKGEARRKEETKEEKKARKAAVKQERQIARMEKKMMRFAINDEFSKRTANVNANDVGGKTVFKYS
jgi:protein LTV1